MKNVGNNIRRSIIKRQEAIERFQARKREFLITKEQIIKEIEEARETWKNTLEKLPVHEFNQ